MNTLPKVLIIDDSSLARLMIRDIVTELGMEAHEAQTADEGIHRFKDIKPRFVVLDIMLSGKNGLEALAEIRGYDNDAIIIMCTSIIGQEDVINKAIEFGADDYITKPFKKEEMMRIFRKYGENLVQE